MKSGKKKGRNFAEAVFRMEVNRGNDEILAVIKELTEMLNAPELKSLRRALNVWTKNLMQKHMQDAKTIEKINQIDDIFGDFNMVEAVYENWGDAYRQEGEAKLLVRQLTRRFGPLPKWAQTRVSKAKSEQLEKWADAIFDASNLTEVIGAPKSSVRK